MIYIMFRTAYSTSHRITYLHVDTIGLTGLGLCIW